MQRDYIAHKEAQFAISMAEICGTADAAKLREAELIEKYKTLEKSYNTIIPPLRILAQRVGRTTAKIRAEWALCEAMLEWRNEREFIALIEQFLIASGISTTAFGRTICSDHRFFFEVKKGRGCTLRRAEQVDKFIELKIAEFKASRPQEAAA
jgi:hypothetical protein